MLCKSNGIKSYNQINHGEYVNRNEFSFPTPALRLPARHCARAHPVGRTGGRNPWRPLPHPDLPLPRDLRPPGPGRSRGRHRRGRGTETPQGSRQGTPAARLCLCRRPGGRAQQPPRARLLGLRDGGHRRRGARPLGRAGRTGPRRCPHVPVLRHPLGPRLAGGGARDARACRRPGLCPRLADGERLLRPPDGRHHRCPVQERHPHVRPLPRPVRVLPPRGLGGGAGGACASPCLAGPARAGRERRPHRAPPGGGRRHPLRPRQPQRLHQPLPLLDEPLRCERGRCRGMGPQRVCRLRRRRALRGGHRAQLLRPDRRARHVPPRALCAGAYLYY